MLRSSTSSSEPVAARNRKWLMFALTMITAIVGGGVFCWVGLEIPPITYIQLIGDVVPATPGAAVCSCTWEMAA